MRLSLSWILSHIKVQSKEIDIKNLIEKFDATTAEIEEIEHIKVDINKFALAKVTKIDDENIVLESSEFRKKVTLATRKDITFDAFYLIKKEGRSFDWASLGDMGSTKDGLMPSLFCSQEQLKGQWKDSFETEDYIIVIDNKSLTHRPDLWSHRGIAREMAAILQKPLIPEDNFLVPKLIKHYAHKASFTGSSSFTLEIAQEPGSCGLVCKRLAGLYINSIENKASVVHYAVRLARVDSKPINAIVDATNYVMFDIGQPMHAFDANAITSNLIIGRCAHAGETLELLDGETVTLQEKDYVLTDGSKPIALAGIMGGKNTSVQLVTKSLLIESANFDPSAIRKTATRLKKRTEASTRFEKSLDPNQNTQALLRFLKVMQDCNIMYDAPEAIASIGLLSEEKIIIVSQDLIDRKIGTHVNSDKIEKILQALGFGVKINYDKEPLLYTITVPTYRSTKDVTIAEDIVEEIARYIGYDSIMPTLPSRMMVPFQTRLVHQIRSVKEHLAFSMAMHEIQSYAFYDEEFLRILKYEPQDTLRIANPLSEHWQRLITSLVPNLLKALYINHTKAETLRFFEINPVWFYQEEAIEAMECSGILFEHKNELDFYQCKLLLSSLFDLLKLPVEWRKPTSSLEPWYNNHQTSELFYEEKVIGRAGKISKPFLHTLAEGDAFIFELDANFLLNYEAPIPVYKPIPKYPEVHLDISIMVPLVITVHELEKIISQADPKIKQVWLLDFYQRPEWKDQKSLTFRFMIYDEQKTLTKDEIDTIWKHVVKQIEKVGSVR